MGFSIKKAVKDSRETILYCLRLSYRASGFYTVFRMASRFVSTGLAIGMTALTGRLVDVLAGNGTGGMKAVLWFFGLILVVKLGMKICSDMNLYCTSMHDEILRNFLNSYTMGESVKADLEYYDSPAFYDAIESVRRDSYSIVGIIWNIMDGAGALAAFIGTFSPYRPRSFWLSDVYDPGCDSFGYCGQTVYKVYLRLGPEAYR